MLRAVEYEYLSRPFWSEGRYMMTRVLHELVIRKILHISNRKKIIHEREPRPRIRPFIMKGNEQMEQPELYDTFFLDIIAQSEGMWVTELVLRSHALLDHDSENFKTQFVKPVLKQKNYLNSLGRCSSNARTLVNEIETPLKELTEHAKSRIDPKYCANRLNFLGINYILLDAETRKVLGKELPAIQFEFSTNFPSADISFSSLDYASFGSTFGDTSFDSSFGDSAFDGFGGGDFGGGGVDGHW